MNCCKKQDDENDKKMISGSEISSNEPISKKPHNHKKHMLHMILCCGLPLLIIFVLPMFGYKGFLTSIAPFICPIMMLVMMPMMMKSNGESCHSNSSPAETKSLEEKQL